MAKAPPGEPGHGKLEPNLRVALAFELAKKLAPTQNRVSCSPTCSDQNASRFLTDPEPDREHKSPQQGSRMANDVQGREFAEKMRACPTNVLLRIWESETVAATSRSRSKTARLLKSGCGRRTPRSRDRQINRDVCRAYGRDVRRRAADDFTEDEMFDPLPTRRPGYVSKPKTLEG
jgi:hypothetical protein